MSTALDNYNLDDDSLTIEEREYRRIEPLLGEWVEVNAESSSLDRRASAREIQAIMDGGYPEGASS